MALFQRRPPSGSLKYPAHSRYPARSWLKKRAVLAARLSRFCSDCEQRSARTLQITCMSDQQLKTLWTPGLRSNSEITRGRDRLKLARSRALMVQLGGPVGTFDVIGSKGIAVRASMARILGLGTQPVGWYRSRDGIAEMLFAIGLLASAVGHMAVETGLLVRTEIDEVREGGDDAGRGRSSAMPQKSNPRSTEYVEGLSRAIQSKAAGLYAILWQSNERNGGVWIAEWPLVPEHFLLASSALRHANKLIGGLVVNKGKMLANLNLDGGAVLSEAFAEALAPLLGRTQAYDFIKASVQRARTQNRSVASVISEATEIIGQLSGADLDRLLDPSRHVGLSAELVDLACSEAEVSLRS